MNLNKNVIIEILSEYVKKPVYKIDNIILTKSVSDVDLLLVDYDTNNRNFILLSEYHKRVSDNRNNKINNLLQLKDNKYDTI